MRETIKQPIAEDTPFRKRSRLDSFLIWAGFKRPPEKEVAQAYMLNLFRSNNR